MQIYAKKEKKSEKFSGNAQFRGYGLSVMGDGLWITGYGLWVTGYGLQVMG